jgi:hypothetical protein
MVGTKSGESWRLAGALTAPSGMPLASTAIERLTPPVFLKVHRAPCCLLPSTRGLGYAAVDGHLR